MYVLDYVFNKGRCSFGSMVVYKMRYYSFHQYCHFLHQVLYHQLFFQLGFTPCKSEQPLQDIKLKQKRRKDKKHTRKGVQKEPTVSVNFTLKDIYIIGQRKAFYRQRIPQPSYAKKETADVEILIAFRNGDSKNHVIYQNNEQTSHENNEVEPVQVIQMNIIPIEKISAGYIQR